MATTEGARFPADPASVGAARKFVVRQLEAHGVERWPADLLVSELATNVIIHAATEFEVVVHVNGVVRIAVADDSLSPPEPRTPAPDSVNGRGLQILDKLVTRWGVEKRRDADGKIVWFELPSND